MIYKDETLHELEIVLDIVCQLAERELTVFLPTNQKEQIPYIKKEIIKTLDKIPDYVDPAVIAIQHDNWLFNDYEE